MTILADAVLIVGAAVYAYWLYQTAIALGGLAGPRPLPRSDHAVRFAIVVPAHDEEAVIGPLLESLFAQRYPRDRFDVYVSCDRCTDRTAEIAAHAGARVLTVPPDRTGGKTANLAYALRTIALDRYDAVAVFDADNLARDEFLARMSDHLAAHPEVAAVQGYLDVKNPADTWVTRVYALSFWYVNRFWQLARSRLRLSVILGGTGEVVRTQLLRDRGFDWESLTDDLELTCLIVMGGGRVGWEPLAIAYDEKPTGIQASLRQRERWVRGHYWSLRRFGPRLLARALRTGSPRYLDLLAHLIVPGRAAVLYAGMFTGYAVAILAVLLAPALAADHPLARSAGLFASLATLQCMLVLVVAPSIHAGRLTLGYVRDILSFFLYGLIWIPRLLGIAVAPGSDAWVRTAHTRALTLGDVRAPNERRRGGP